MSADASAGVLTLNVGKFVGTARTSGVAPLSGGRPRAAGSW